MERENIQLGSQLLSQWFGIQTDWEEMMQKVPLSPHFSREEWLTISSLLQSRWGRQPAVQVETIWNSFVSDYEKNKSLRRQVHGLDKEVEQNDIKLSQFIRTLIVPLFITKTAALYFGIKMTQYPGEGYGYGLVFSLALTASSFLWFALKNPNLK